MGGQMGIESEEEEGSVVGFSTLFAKQQGKEKAPAPADICGKKILIVDDNPTNRIILLRQLGPWGCTVEEAADGETALAKMPDAVDSHSPFDIAILDMVMPDLDGVTLGRKIKADSKIGKTQLVMLTSLGNRGDAKVMQEVGFSAYLIKPVKSSQLRACLGMVVSNHGLQSAGQGIPLVTRHSVAEQRKLNIKILLAEDNPINQKVVLRTLEKMGYRAEAVIDGKEVLSALEKIDYDLILMDVQMPEMNGFETTQGIRQKEKNTGRHVHIIAMTAHAMKGDRERCLEAGMDDYISKPIQANSLWDAIKRWGKETPDKPEGTGSDGYEGGFDKELLLKYLNGDEPFLREIVGMFLEDTPKQIQKMKDYFDAQDFTKLGFHAHALKGSAGHIYAKAIARAALGIETATKNQELDNIATMLGQIEMEFSKFKEAVMTGGL
jgi:CheY-like chemotaxis protein